MFRREFGSVSAKVSRNMVTHPHRIALIVGAMKCGTTSLFEYLASHPAVCRSVPKEPNFFYRAAWPAGMADYAAFWPGFDPDRHEIALEASTGYSKWPDIPDVTPRIEEFAARHGTRFKFIYIVRDPLRMIGSGLGHGQDRGWGGGDRERLIDHLLNVADFDAQLARYRARFAPEDMHVLQLERLTVDQAGQIAAAARFLGLDGGAAAPATATRHNSTEIREVIRSRKAAVARISRVVPLKPLWNLVPAAARDGLRPLASRLIGGGAPRPAHPPNRWRLSDAERQQIARRLAPGVRALASAHDIDPALWADYAAALEGRHWEA
jgi:hypothetical protein